MWSGSIISPLRPFRRGAFRRDVRRAAPARRSSRRFAIIARRRCVMNDRRRVLAGALVALVFLGVLPPSTLAQQSAPPPLPASAPAVVEVMPPEQPAAHRADIYDVGAGVVTAARMPFNLALCGLGAVTGTVLFVV